MIPVPHRDGQSPIYDKPADEEEDDPYTYVYPIMNMCSFKYIESLYNERVPTINRNSAVDRICLR